MLFFQCCNYATLHLSSSSQTNKRAMFFNGLMIRPDFINFWSFQAILFISIFSRTNGKYQTLLLPIKLYRQHAFYEAVDVTFKNLPYFTYNQSVFVKYRRDLIFQVHKIPAENIKIQIVNMQSKTFVFENEDTKQLSIVDETVDTSLQAVDLDPFLQKYYPLNQYSWSIYNPQGKNYSPLSELKSQDNNLPMSLMEPSFILLRFKHSAQKQSEEQSLSFQKFETFESSTQIKSEKSREKTIAEVIELVKQWRNLFTHGFGQPRKRLNLQDAAKVIGVSKKTLDDYYYHLRLAEELGFDFHKNLSEKKRIMYAFVKIQKNKLNNKAQKKSCYIKHSQKLKILNQYDANTYKIKKSHKYMAKLEENTQSSSVEQSHLINSQRISSIESENQSLQSFPIIDHGNYPRRADEIEQQFFNAFNVPKQSQIYHLEYRQDSNIYNRYTGFDFSRNLYQFD